MTADPIPFGRPMLDEGAIAAVADVLRSGMLVHGKVTHAFEQAFATRVGARHAIAVSSGTAALHLVLFVRGIGPGHRVAVPAMTHVATAHAVELLGARPVFVDVDDSSGNLDPKALAQESDLAAVTVVHYLGLPCDMAAIKAEAGRCGAFVLEDCALALDASYAGAKVGTLGLAGCFSFYPAKHMTSIEGGMVTTDGDELAAAVVRARAFGYDRSFAERRKPGVYDVIALGFNYRMSEVDAAIGLSQLARLDDFQARRADHFERLRRGLADLDEVTVFAAQQGQAVSSHYCLNATLPRDGSVDRDKIVSYLTSQGIGTSVHYPAAVPLFTYYREKYGYREGQFPNAEWLASQTISLPIGPHLPDDGPERIAAAFKSAIMAART